MDARYRALPRRDGCPSKRPLDCRTFYSRGGERNFLDLFGKAGQQANADVILTAASGKEKENDDVVVE
jgi:hypothetical protein